MAEPDLTTPTYHISMWDQPVPTYVCLLCHIGGLSLEDVAAHLETLHARAAVPTPMIPSLLAMRATDDARLAAVATASAEAVSDVPAPVLEEDTAHG